jgi:hypothetical protein
MGSIQLLKDAVDLLNLIEANTEGGIGGGGTPSGTPNQVVATDPSGVATSPAALRALVAADIPIVTSAKPLHAGFTRFAATPCYVGDIRMY